MIVGLDHIAIAVEDIEVAVNRFLNDLGLPLKGRDVVEHQKTRVAFFPVKGTQVELIHPMDGEGPVQAYLDRKGPGLHHICFETDDIDADFQRLKEKGYRFLSEEPGPGAHGSRVIFIHPKSVDGVLIELAQHQ